MSDEQHSSPTAKRQKPKSKRSSAPQRKLPFSLLGQIVYDAGCPIARVHSLPTSHNDDSSDESLENCLVAGQLDHVEFDLRTFAHLLINVANAYPRDCDLIAGLDLTADRESFFKEAKTGIGSRILSETCVFVGAIADFGTDGYCVRYVDAFTKGAFWRAIQSVNCVNLPAGKGGLHMETSHLSMVPAPTVGRFIVVETISPEVLVALHIALEYYFVVTAAIDLYAGYATLGRQVPYDSMIRGGTRRARHYTIDFLYVLTHEHRLKLPRWHKQRTSVLYDDKYPADIYIGRGTTVLQLSEEHERGNGLPSNEPFRPWKILVIPAVPRVRYWRQPHPLTSTRLLNATEAWAWTIWYEHRLVYIHMANLFHNISKKVSPPKDFMFNLSHIDKLIFDDENYTKSKLYFWAYQSLEMVQSELLMIIRRWRNYGPTIILSPSGAFRPVDDDRFAKYTERIEKLLKDMSDCMGNFQDLIEDCKAKQREIAALRDGLFNGSAVLESRNSLRTADQSLEQTKTAIAQGENIKALTIVSIFFLPLAFVTSVFGMTNLPESGNMTAFAIVLVCICIPAYTLIGSIMNTRGLQIWRTAIQWLLHKIPKSWMSPKYRTFSELAKQTYQLATWNIESDEEDGNTKKPKNPLESFKSHAKTLGKSSSSHTANEDGLDQANSNFKPTFASNINDAKQQDSNQPFISPSNGDALTDPRNEESLGTNTPSGNLQHSQSAPRGPEKGGPKWKLKGWNRHPREDGETERDVEKATTSSVK